MKSLETTLTGALRREQTTETSIKQLEAEIEQLNRLVTNALTHSPVYMFFFFHFKLCSNYTWHKMLLRYEPSLDFET